MTYSKYGNKKINGFDSIKEYSRWQERVFRGVSYYADFVYWQNSKFVVEDCKGFKTKEYQLKKKMLYYFHRINIKET